MSFKFVPRAASILIMTNLAIGGQFVSNVHAAGSVPVASTGPAAGDTAITPQISLPQSPVASPPAGLAIVTPTAPVAPVDTTQPAPQQSDVECMAKVIVHEAGNQSPRGQRAVAQVIRTRMKMHGKRASACDIVRQQGQFFAVDRYQPARSSARWTNAVEIAEATLRGEGEELVPGALFFHTVNAPMRGRRLVARIEGHVFYR